MTSLKAVRISLVRLVLYQTKSVQDYLEFGFFVFFPLFTLTSTFGLFSRSLLNGSCVASESLHSKARAAVVNLVCVFPFRSRTFIEAVFFVVEVYVTCGNQFVKVFSCQKDSRNPFFGSHY